MTEPDFWALIRDTQTPDCGAHVKRLVDKLCTLSTNEVLHFGWWWHKKLAEAYRWDLWGAAYIINGGCSDDGFEYLRDWLILQGQKAYETALENPDHLAEALQHECYPALIAYERLTGLNDYYDARKTLGFEWPKLPALGEGWDFDDSKLMRERYPRLHKTHLGKDD